MSTRKEYCKWADKLDTLGKENELAVRFFADEYPLRLTIQPYTGVGSQLSLLENMERRGIKPGAVITMTFDNEKVRYNVSDRFAITKTLLDRFAGAFQGRCLAWYALLFEELHAEGKVTKDALSALDHAARME